MQAYQDRLKRYLFVIKIFSCYFVHAVYKLLRMLNIWKLPNVEGEGGPETEVRRVVSGQKLYNQHGWIYSSI